MRLNRTKHVRNEVIFPKIVFYTSADLRTHWRSKDPGLKVQFKLILIEMLDLHSLVNAGFQSILSLGVSRDFKKAH